MSEKSVEEGNGSKSEGGKPLEIEVNITGKEEIEKLQNELKEALAGKESAEEKLEKVKNIQAQIAEKESERERQIKEIAEKQKRMAEDLEKERTAKEDAINKLELAAEKEFQKAKSTFLEQAKGHVSEEKYKEMEGLIDSPEKLSLVKGTFGWLDENLKKGAEAVQTLAKQAEEAEKAKKAGEENTGDGTTTTGEGASGKAPLTSEGPPSSLNVKQYDSFQDMYAELLTREKSKDPKVAAEAKGIINQLWQKMIDEIKRTEKAPVMNVRQEGKLVDVVKAGVKRDRGDVE